MKPSGRLRGVLFRTFLPMEHFDSTAPEEQAVTAWLALGSNLGDRLGYLNLAVRFLEATPGIRVERAGGVYETRAHTLTPGERQPDYLNAVIAIKTTLSPEELLDRCMDIERRAGRARAGAPRWAARTLDIDILAYGRAAYRSDRLSIPHPRLGERKFVLCPWADVSPGWELPEPYHATVAELLARCDDADRPRRTALELRMRPFDGRDGASEK